MEKLEGASNEELAAAYYTADSFRRKVHNAFWERAECLRKQIAIVREYSMREVRLDRREVLSERHKVFPGMTKSLFSKLRRLSNLPGEVEAGFTAGLLDPDRILERALGRDGKAVPGRAGANSDAKDAVDRLRGQGIEPTRQMVMNLSKRSPVTAEKAIAADKAERAAIDRMATAEAKAMAAAILEKERPAVLAACREEARREALAFYDEMTRKYLHPNNEKAAKILQRHKGQWTKEQYKAVLLSVHPDNSASPELRNEAFRVIRANKLFLCPDEEDTKVKVMPAWPKTWADMQAMKGKL